MTRRRSRPQNPTDRAPLAAGTRGSTKRRRIVAPRQRRGAAITPTWTARARRARRFSTEQNRGSLRRSPCVAVSQCGAGASENAIPFNDTTEQPRLKPWTNLEVNTGNIPIINETPVIYPIETGVSQQRTTWRAPNRCRPAPSPVRLSAPAGHQVLRIVDSNAELSFIITPIKKINIGVMRSTTAVTVIATRTDGRWVVANCRTAPRAVSTLKRYLLRTACTGPRKAEQCFIPASSPFPHLFLR
jgi:hypothetical protein